MEKSDFTDSQDKEPEYYFQNSSQDSIYSVDELATKSAEVDTSGGKSELSNSSASEPEKAEAAVLESAAEAETVVESKLDLSSGFVSEPLPGSILVSKPSPGLGVPEGKAGEQAAERQPSKIVIVGTAHVSEKSVEEVRTTIRKLKPDIVAVELCRGRYDSLKGNVQETQVPIKEILGGGKVYFYLIHWLLAYVQKKIGEDMGVKPGAEMLMAIEEAEAAGARIALIDRDIQVTLQRFWGKMKFMEKIRMLSSLVGGLIGIGKGADIDIDNITEQDVVTALVSELRGFAPTAAEVLIDERDAYLAGSILRTAASGNKTIVAVIGAGHKPGVLKYLQDPKSIPPLHTLMEIPKKRFSAGKAIGFGIVALAIAVFLLLLLSGTSPELLVMAFGWWFLINGTLSAAGTLLAGGHPYSIATAFLVAWLTSLNPMMAAGWFAGLVEAKQRNPTTEDIKALAGIETFREMFKNRFMRVLLVASFANVGSVIGTFLGAYVMVQVTGIDPREVILSGFSALGF